MSRDAQKHLMTQATRGLSEQEKARLEGDLYMVGTAGNGWRLPDNEARTVAMLLGVIKSNGDLAAGIAVHYTAVYRGADPIRSGSFDITDQCAFGNIP